jgi:hypothetical protein
MFAWRDFLMKRHFYTCSKSLISNPCLNAEWCIQARMSLAILIIVTIVQRISMWSRYGKCLQCLAEEFQELQQTTYEMYFLKYSQNNTLVRPRRVRLINRNCHLQRRIYSDDFNSLAHWLKFPATANMHLMLCSFSKSVWQQPMSMGRYVQSSRHHLHVSVSSRILRTNMRNRYGRCLLYLTEQFLLHDFSV